MNNIVIELGPQISLEGLHLQHVVVTSPPVFQGLLCPCIIKYVIKITLSQVLYFKIVAGKESVSMTDQSDDEFSHDNLVDNKVNTVIIVFIIF